MFFFLRVVFLYCNKTTNCFFLIWMLSLNFFSHYFVKFQLTKRCGIWSMGRLHFPQHFKNGFPKPTKKASRFDFQIHAACFGGVCHGELPAWIQNLQPETSLFLSTSWSCKSLHISVPQPFHPSRGKDENHVYPIELWSSSESMPLKHLGSMLCTGECHSLATITVESIK